MKDQKDSELQTLKRVVNIVDEALSAGEWQETFLLRSMEKKLKELRDEAVDLQNQFKLDTQAKTLGVGKGQVSNLLTVYVSVYQQDFADLKKWERMLKSITDYSVTRPVYKDEAHVKEMIRGRPDPNKEGYVAVLVKEQDVVKGFAGKPTADKMGYELLNIKEGGVRPAGIQRFVLNGKTYEYSEGTLVLIQSEQPPAAQ